MTPDGARTVLLVDGPAKGRLLTVPGGTSLTMPVIQQPIPGEWDGPLVPRYDTVVYHFTPLNMLGEYLLVGSVRPGIPDAHEVLDVVLTDDAKGAIQPWPAVT